MNYLTKTKEIVIGLNEFVLRNYSYKIDVPKLLDKDKLLNYYTIENIAYFLSDDNWNDLYLLVQKHNSLASYAITESSLYKTTNIQLEKSLELVFINFFKKQDYLYGLITMYTPKILAGALSKYLQNKLIKHMVKQTDDLIEPYTLIAEQIGNLFINIIFYNIPIIKLVVDSIQKKKPLSLLTLESLRDLLKLCIYEVDIIPDSYGLYYFKGALQPVLKRKIILFVIELFLEGHNDFYIVFILLQHEYPTKKEILLSKNSNIGFNKRFCITLGCKILDPLIEQKIFAKSLDYEGDENSKISSTYNLTLSLDKSFELLASATFFRPYLHINNVLVDHNYLFKNSDFSLQVKTNRVNTHNNYYMNATFNPKYINDLFKENVMLSIDTSFLKDFIIFLENLQNKSYYSFTFDELNDVYSFLFIYKINFKLLLEKSGKPHVIHRLITFGIDFNSYYDEGLQETLKKKEDAYYLKLYKIICNYKFFIINMLKELVLYSSFNFFYISKFADSRGRFYMQGYFLNLQVIPIIKAFLKVNKPSQEIFKMNFITIKEIFTGALNLNKEDLNKYNYNSYIEEQTQIIINYYLSYMINISKEDFIIYLNNENINFKDNLQFIIKHIKKPEKIYIFLSYILLYKRKEIKLENLIDLDNTSSGLQILSIIFKSKNLAQLCNIEGTHACDIYNFFLVQLQEELLSLDNQITSLNLPITYINLKNKELLTKECMEELKSKSFTELLTTFINCDLNDSAYVQTFYNLLIMTCKDPEKYIISKKFVWIISDTKLLKYNVTQNDLIQSILIFKYYFDFKKILTIEPWIKANIFNRNIIKYIMMSFGYGNTLIGRYRMIKEYFNEIAILNGISQINTVHINFITGLINSYFSIFRYRYLGKADALLDISNLIAKEINDKHEQHFTIKTKYVEITLYPQKAKKIRISIKNEEENHNYKRMQLTVNLPQDKFDKKKFMQAFPANYIHSLDGFVVHDLTIKFKYINDLLLNLNLFCCFITNHDCFSLGSSYIVFLKPLLIDIYLSMYKLNLLGILEEACNAISVDLYKNIIKYQEAPNSNDYLMGDVINPNFVK